MSVRRKWRSARRGWPAKPSPRASSVWRGRHPRARRSGKETSRSPTMRKANGPGRSVGEIQIARVLAGILPSQTARPNSGPGRISSFTSCAVRQRSSGRASASTRLCFVSQLDPAIGGDPARELQPQPGFVRGRDPLSVEADHVAFGNERDRFSADFVGRKQKAIAHPCGRAPHGRRRSRGGRLPRDFIWLPEGAPDEPIPGSSGLSNTTD